VSLHTVACETVSNLVTKSLRHFVLFNQQISISRLRNGPKNDIPRGKSIFLCSMVKFALSFNVKIWIFFSTVLRKKILPYHFPFLSNAPPLPTIVITNSSFTRSTDSDFVNLSLVWILVSSDAIEPSYSS